MRWKLAALAMLAVMVLILCACHRTPLRDDAGSATPTCADSCAQGLCFQGCSPTRVIALHVRAVAVAPNDDVVFADDNGVHLARGGALQDISVSNATEVDKIARSGDMTVWCGREGCFSRTGAAPPTADEKIAGSVATDGAHVMTSWVSHTMDEDGHGPEYYEDKPAETATVTVRGVGVHDTFLTVGEITRLDDADLHRTGTTLLVRGSDLLVPYANEVKAISLSNGDMRTFAKLPDNVIAFDGALHEDGIDVLALELVDGGAGETLILRLDAHARVVHKITTSAKRFVGPAMVTSGDVLSRVVDDHVDSLGIRADLAAVAADGTNVLVRAGVIEIRRPH